MKKRLASWLTRSALASFRALCAPAARRFDRACADPAGTQRTLLREILAAHETTDYGRAHGLTRELSLEELRRRVPVSRYAGELEGWAEKQRGAPARSVLAPGGAQVFETTSGSSGRRKQIPYNSALRASFEAYFRVWAHDLLTHGPKFETLRIYLSVSPGGALDEQEARSGFEDDTEYLSPALRQILRRFLTAPTSLKGIRDAHEFRLVLAAHLLADAELEIVSIWHPSFWLVLWDFVGLHREELARAVEAGSVLSAEREWLFTPNPRAAALLRGSAPLDPMRFWPTLKWVSAWDSAASRGPAERLRALLPTVAFQGKGLLATEAPLTIPLYGRGFVPFLTEVFFEFLREDGSLHLLHELQTGESYELVVSQRGGFLRYALGDLVRVTRVHPGGLPELEFRGRAGDVSDLVGEKLSAAYITDHLEPELRRRYQVESLCVLPMQPETGAPHYLALVSAPVTTPEWELEVTRFLDARLSESFHFGYARRLMQLGPTRLRAVPDLSTRLLEHYRDVRGMKLGDIKLKVLVPSPGESLEILTTLDPGGRLYGT